MGRPKKTDQDVELPTFEPKPDGDCWQCPACNQWTPKGDGDWDYTCAHCGAVPSSLNDVRRVMMIAGVKVSFTTNAVVRYFVDANKLAQKKPTGNTYT